MAKQHLSSNTCALTVATSLFVEQHQRDTDSGEHLFQLVYDELRAIARRLMRGEREDHTLQPTALVHEAYTRMVNLEMAWVGRAHLISMATRTMRRVLVDHARAHRSLKRGNGIHKMTVDDDEEPMAAAPSWDLLDLDLALRELYELDDRQGQATELLYFGGLNYEEIAAVMETSPATVGRDIRHAKAWLRRRLM